MKRLLFICGLVFLASAARAQTPVGLLTTPRVYYSNASGPLSGGCLFFYQSGTSTPQATYTDYTGTFQASNPVILDTLGSASVYLSSATYRVKLVSAGGVNCASGSQQWQIDGVTTANFLNLANIWTALQTFNAGIISTTGTFSGTVTANGQFLCSNFDNIRCVNSATTGADLGAKINTADASLGANAGEIWIDSSAGTTWTTATTFSGPRNIKFRNGASYSIPLGNINSGNFPYVFDCGGRMQAVLNFTGGAGIAFNMNWAQFPSGSLNNVGYGLRHCTVNGPGGANGTGGNVGTGVSIGDVTHNTLGATLEDVQLGGGFALGYTIVSIGSFGAELLNSTIRDNTQNFLINITSGGGMENVFIAHTFFQQAGSGIFMQADSWKIAGTGQIELTCESCSFDGDQINLGGNAANTITFIRRHSESLGNSAVVPVLISNGQTTDISPKTQWDGVVTSSASGIAVSGGTYSLQDGAWGAQAGAPVASAITQSGTGNVSVQRPFMIATNVSGISTGGSGWFTNFDPASGTCTFLGANCTLDIARGTSTLGSIAIPAGTCAATVTTSAPGTLTTNTVIWSYAPFSVPATNGVLTLNPWTTVGNVNFSLCNPTAGSITPTGLVVNWKVINQ